MKTNKYLIYISLIIFSFLLASYNNALTQDASPANWLFPDGNANATKQVIHKSKAQPIDSMKVKWFSSAIAGDVKPLVGNIIKNPRLFPDFIYTPNEMAAVVGNKIVIIDGTGRTYIQNDIPNFINRISVLLDTTLADGQVIGPIKTSVVMGLETIETDRTNERDNDTMAYAYIAGYSPIQKKAEIIKRLAVDMREFAPNYSVSLKPIFAAQRGTKVNYYAVANMAKPNLDKFVDGNDDLPFLKGVLQFEAEIGLSNYPQTDIGEHITKQASYNGGHDFAFAQASIKNYFSFGEEKFNIAMPQHIDINKDILITAGSAFSNIYLNRNYIQKMDILEAAMTGDIDNSGEISKSHVFGEKPYIRNYLIDLYNLQTGEVEPLQLLSMQYSNQDGSEGRSSLFLTKDSDDANTTYAPASDDTLGSMYFGNENHFWSLATGNVDGDTFKGDKYPRNPGNEVIVTNSSSEFVAPNSQISVLKYFGDETVSSSPDRVFNPFDTVATHKINGYIAAINDLDGDNTNLRDEILLVDGSKIRIMRMKDYNDPDFDLGNKFDTVFTYDFANETITHAMIADMEGDGLNDIIVTTFKGTYVIGMPLANILSINTPKADRTDEICLGDSLLIQWRNIVQNYTKMDLFFLESIDGVIADTLIEVETGIANELDTIDYYYVVNQKLLGKTGRFIIKGQDRPDEQTDTTGVLIFSSARVFLDTQEIPKAYAGQSFEIKGVSTCFDSLSLSISSESGTFIENMFYQEDIASSTFAVSATLTCPEFNSCQAIDSTNDFQYYVTTYRNGFSIVSDTLTARINPAPFDIEIDTVQTASPTKNISWISEKYEDLCDTLDVYYSIDKGENFIFIEQILSEFDAYSWNLPINMPDSVMLRLCCNSSCFRVDTLLTNTNVSSIKMVAPNPVAPPLEKAEIIYTPKITGEINIEIVDFNNSVLAYLVRSERKIKNTVYTAIWDGRNLRGDLVHNGLYYIRIEYSDGSVEIEPIYVKK